MLRTPAPRTSLRRAAVTSTIAASTTTRIDLREQVLNFPSQPVITKDNVTIDIDAVLYYRVADPQKATYAVQNLPYALETLTRTTLRNIVGEMELDATLVSRDQINKRMREVIEEASIGWGVDVTRVELQAIEPPRDIQQSMELQMRAERERRAAVTNAEAGKRAAILEAYAAPVSPALSEETIITEPTQPLGIQEPSSPSRSRPDSMPIPVGGTPPPTGWDGTVLTQVEAHLARVGGPGQRRRRLGRGARRQRQVALGGGQPRRGVEPEPPGTGQVHLGPGVRVGLPHRDDAIDRIEVTALAERYADRQPDLADLCLIRLSELNPKLPVITVDSDFRHYRRNRREMIPLVMPSDVDGG